MITQRAKVLIYALTILLVSVVLASIFNFDSAILITFGEQYWYSVLLLVFFLLAISVRYARYRVGASIPNQHDEQKSEKGFKALRVALIGGVVFYPVAYLVFGVDLVNADDLGSMIGLASFIAVLPISIICLVTAHVFQRKDTEFAIKLLELPFFLGTILYIFYSAFLS